MEDITKEEILHSHSAICPSFTRHFGSFDSVGNKLTLELIFSHTPSEGSTMTPTEMVANLVKNRFRPIKSYSCQLHNLKCDTATTPMDSNYTYKHSQVEGSNMSLIHVVYHTSIFNITGDYTLPGKLFKWDADLVTSYMQDLGRCSEVSTKHFTHQDSRLHVKTYYHYTKQGTTYAVYPSRDSITYQHPDSIHCSNVNGTFHVSGTNIKRCDMFVNGRSMKLVNPTNTVREGIWEFQNEFTRFSKAGNTHTVTIDCNDEAKFDIHHVFDTRVLFDPIGDKFDHEIVYYQKGGWFW